MWDSFGSISPGALAIGRPGTLSQVSLSRVSRSRSAGSGRNIAFGRAPWTYTGRRRMAR
jgi:hypothetical protein